MTPAEKTAQHPMPGALTSAPRPPNFLFLFPDQQRPDWLEFNEALPIRTPSLVRLATDGVRFTNAVTPSPLCAPARACLASGRGYWSCRVPDNARDYPLNLPTYYQSLREAGYRVAGVGKFDLHKDTSHPANLDWHLDGSRLLHEWGFTDGIDNEGKLDGSTSYQAAGAPRGPYLKFLADRDLADLYVQEHRERNDHLDAYTTALPDETYCDNWVAENGKSMVSGFPEGTPWHMVVNFTGPHNPMDVTESMRKSVERRSLPTAIRNEKHGQNDLVRNRQNYAAMIENIDRLIGEIIDVVRERGELDHTIIIYSSDHGEMLGDFGRFGKSTWRFASAHVPLIISGPVLQRGVVSDALADLTDVTATILDYAGCEPLPQMSGRSLRPVLEGQSDTHREVVLSGLGAWRMAFDGRHKLVEEDGEAPRLFDLQRDPCELENLAARHPEVVESLHRHLSAAES